jgi:hypothetical protein
MDPTAVLTPVVAALASGLGAFSANLALERRKQQSLLRQEAYSEFVRTTVEVLAATDRNAPKIREAMARGVDAKLRMVIHAPTVVARALVAFDRAMISNNSEAQRRAFVRLVQELRADTPQRSAKLGDDDVYRLVYGEEPRNRETAGR